MGTARDIFEQITEIWIVVGVLGSQPFQTANSWQVASSGMFLASPPGHQSVFTPQGPPLTLPGLNLLFH